MPVGGILSAAVFQAERKPALSEVEGDLACSATIVKCKLHATGNFRRDNYKLAATSKKELPYLKPSQEDLCDAANLFSTPQPV
jgi:hypothetical protein